MDRRWHQAPGWFHTLSPSQQARLLADYRLERFSQKDLEKRRRRLEWEAVGHMMKGG